MAVRRRAGRGGGTSASKRQTPSLAVKPAGTPSRRGGGGALDAAVVAAVTALALATRLYRIAEPARIVFDEFHFSQFVDDYAAGRYLFDIHPPLAKLMLYAAGWLGGYVPAPDDYKFDMIGKEFGNMLYVPQRTLAATFGSLIPATLYLTCRALGVGVLPALTAASLSVTDTLLLIESRLVLTDSQLIFYIQAALLCALMLWRTSKRTAARPAWLVATSVFGGCAISTKWTALVVPAMIALVSLTGAIFPLNGERLEFAEMAVAGCIAISIYVASFYAHFKLLPLSGPGDLFMPCWFRRHLVGQSTCTDSSVEGLEPLSFIRSFVYLNKEMYRANSQIEQRHHWEATWYEWVYNARGILYLDEDGGNGTREKVYVVVNPVLAPLAFAAVLACVLWLAVSCGPRGYLRGGVQTQSGKASRRKSSIRKGAARTDASGDEGELDDLGLAPKDWSAKMREPSVVAFFVAGYALNLLPYAAVKRCTFVYHYLPSLQFGIVLVSLCLELFLPSRLPVRLVCCLVIIGACAAALLAYSPWVYALPLGEREHRALQLMPRWN